MQRHVKCGSAEANACGEGGWSGNGTIIFDWQVRCDKPEVVLKFVAMVAKASLRFLLDLVATHWVR
jgi:hypothetical protein